MASKGLRRFPIKVHEKLKRATNLHIPLKPLLAILCVCALHEQRAPVSKVWKKIKNTNKLLKGIRRRVYFSRGCKPALSADRSLMCGVMPETVASGKVVYREVCTDPERSGEHDRRE